MRSNVEKTVSDKVERQSSHELLDLYLRRLEADPELQPEAFLKQFPEVSAEVSGLLSAVRGLHLASKASEDAQPLSNLSQLGDFKLEGIIGRGGMGLVFQAHQISLDRKVALKVLAASAAIDPINRQRFQLEARAAASLQHPNIVQIYAVGTESQVDYYAMQFIEGSSIADILDGVKQPQKAMSAAWFGGDHAERTTSEEHASATDAASDRERAASPPMMRGHAFAPLQAAVIAEAVAEA
ncbi:MAG: protein kinase, partial [bacterium]|nr:protein kinase [bacterium]